ncbi:HAMP domain-containing sensor histidine kinase [Paratractidigestivibacter sp.]|uniref:sensor histidine kinase n=1 Tax=Paratractidigestivibacter sp. TaxID=2847316 RepID=UPI002ABE0AEC|nr:HAMP domain-containing sensor histidine kinase [Paratractidigestivibacter sp.]
MLDKLRREFTLITFGLSGVVLLIALVMTFVSNVTMQNNVTMSLLNRGLEVGHALNPQMGSKDREGTVGADSMLTVSVDVTPSGIVLNKSESPVGLDEDALDEIVAKAVSGSETSGTNWARHLAWAKKSTVYGLRIAICDTYSRDVSLIRQGISGVIIFLMSLCALYAVSRALANRSIKPVSEAWDAQRRFISDASHELKTPLAVILANVQILQRSKDMSAEDMRWVGRTADEAEHMKGLVEDLLTLARADEAKAGSVGAAGPMVELDLSEIVDECALEFDAVAFERGCTISCETEPEVMVTGDKQQLERVMNTLVDNATKYAAKDSEVKLSARRDGKKAHVTVNNKGAVIDAEDLAHLFDRFYRTDKARSREETGGFGLGLAIAKSIVDAHGGKIWATSDAASGTTFHVTL